MQIHNSFALLTAIGMLYAALSSLPVQAHSLTGAAHGRLHLFLQAGEPGNQDAGTQNPADLLPAGDGKDTTVRLCTTCHGVDKFIQVRHDKDGWDDVITDMEAKGLHASDSDLDKVSDYLSLHLGDSAQSPPAQGQNPAK